MSFDKQKYWDLKKRGIRGQGAKSPKIISFKETDETTQLFDPVKKQFVKVNRERRRRKVVDRTYTKKGYRYGRKLKVKRK